MAAAISGSHVCPDVTSARQHLHRSGVQDAVNTTEPVVARCPHRHHGIAFANAVNGVRDHTMGDALNLCVVGDVQRRCAKRLADGSQSFRRAQIKSAPRAFPVHVH
jgi:hypothetical protein